MSSRYVEVNFDGLVGPNHNYSGLSTGNIASVNHEGQISSPREAALQGLAKAEYLMNRGLTQGIILPQQRPAINFLKEHGFSGSDTEILDKAYKTHPKLLSIAFSASSMWAANAATVVPSNDSDDAKLHLIVANLSTKAHRAIEATWTHRYLSKVFSNEKYFRVHQALTGGDTFSDEGAANHTRLASNHSSKGVHLFTYGRSVWTQKPAPQKFVARQTLEACQSLARMGGVEKQSIYVQQNPAAIDAGVFHNDVICVGNENLLFSHEAAFTHTSHHELKSFLAAKIHDYQWLEVKNEEVPLEKCVSSYLFNSQLLRAPEGHFFLLCPIECQEELKVKNYLTQLCASHPLLKEWVPLDLRQSMRNGGGPACLRLRVLMSQEELTSVHNEALLNIERLEALRKIVKKYYREKLSVDDLRDPHFLKDSYTALDEFTQVLNTGSLYEFQK